MLLNEKQEHLQTAEIAAVINLVLDVRASKVASSHLTGNKRRHPAPAPYCLHMASLPSPLLLLLLVPVPVLHAACGRRWAAVLSSLAVLHLAHRCIMSLCACSVRQGPVPTRAQARPLPGSFLRPPYQP